MPPRHRTVLLTAAAVVLFSYGILWGLPNLVDFAQDSLVPVGALAERGADFEQVTSYRYPPLHFHVLRLAYLPVRVLARHHAIADNPKVRATLFILAARIVSLVMGLGVLVAIRRTGRRLWGDGVGCVAAALFALAPGTLYYVKNANLDMPYLFWLAWALYFYVRALEDGRAKHYVLLGLFSALAVCTKDQAYAFILLMPLPILYKKMGTGPISVRPLFLGAVAFLIPFVLIHNILFDPGAFKRHVETILGPGSEGWRLFASGSAGQIRLFVETVLRLADAWTVGGLALAVIGLCIVLRRRERSVERLALLVPLVSYHISFLAVVGYVPTRFVLPMVLVLSLFAARGVTWLWCSADIPVRTTNGRGEAAPPSLMRRATAAILIACLALGGLSVNYVMSSYSRYDAQIWLERNAEALGRIAFISPADDALDMRDMPRFNKPVEPVPVRPDLAAVRETAPDALVLSLGPGHPAAGWMPMQPSSILRRHVGTWGLARSMPRPEEDFYSRMISGEEGYAVAAQFASPLAPFVPEVAESLNRTIVILVRDEGAAP